MDRLFRPNVGLPKIRGRNVFQIYKHYVADFPRGEIDAALNDFFKNGKLVGKNDSISSELRTRGDIESNNKKLFDAVATYTKSLCYAEYNGEAYALTLASRSLALYQLEEYEKCVADINLCLEAQYPSKLKPLVIIRKALCFKSMGHLTEMRKLLMELLNTIDQELLDLTETQCDVYRYTISRLIISKFEKVEEPVQNFYVLPSFDQNPNFLGASTSVTLKFDKQNGRRVIANRDIAIGEVLFVEKAYAFIPITKERNEVDQRSCQYCLRPGLNLVPCRMCVKHVYCNEVCRLNAWNEFHQWECLALRSDFIEFFSRSMHLALRIMLKARYTGRDEFPLVKQSHISQFGNMANNYPYLVSSSPINMNEISKEGMPSTAMAAALLVGYLHLHTNFFKTLQRERPNCINVSERKLMDKLGGSIIQHSMQFHIIVSNTDDRIGNSDEVISYFTNATIYANPSIKLLNRSCAPNTTKYCIGDTVVIKAIQQIAENEEIFTSYVDNQCVQRIRRNLILDKFGIECKCFACKDPSMDNDAYNCVQCGGPAVKVGLDIFFMPTLCVCISCDCQFILSRESTILDRMCFAACTRFAIFNNIENANVCLQIANNMYKQYHSTIFSLYSLLLVHYIERENLKNALVVTKQFLHSLSLKYEVHTSMARANLQYKFIKNWLELFERPTCKMNKWELCELFEVIQEFIEDAKIIYELHCPPMLTHLCKLEKRALKLEKSELPKASNTSK